MVLKECVTILSAESGFPTNWITQYNFQTPPEIANSFTGIYNRTNSTSNLLFERLSTSLLNGEYLEVDKAMELDEISKTIDGIITSIDLDPTLIDIQNQISSNLLFHFVNPLKSSIREYKSFIHSLSRSLKFNEHSVLFEAISLNQSFSFNNNPFIFDDIKLTRNFLINVRLARIDHNLSVKKEILNELILLKNELEGTVSNSLKIIDKVLIDKCNFLIKKILYRFQEDSKNYLYAFDFEDKELQPEDLKITFYKKFDEITESHYEKTNNHANQRRKWIEDIYYKIEKKEPLNFKDYHVSIKEYKDGTKNLTQVENLNENFKTLYKSEIERASNLFDKRALHITYNYMMNNEFSIMLNQNEIDFNSIVSKYKEIKNLQLETRIKNYFPCIKYANYLSAKIDSFFKNIEVDCDIVKPFIDKFESALKDSYENYEWCRDKNFLAFQLPSTECKINYENDGINYSFFLSSSFVLPINYEKVQREIKEFSRKLEKYKTLLEVHENLKSEKSIIKDLREDIQKNDRRSIEILGIFSAIVLFASSSVQIFSIKNILFKDALKFMLCFAYSLTLFVFLVWLITRENIKSVTIIHRIFFFSLAFIALISFLFTINLWPFNK